MQESFIKSISSKSSSFPEGLNGLNPSLEHLWFRGNFELLKSHKRVGIVRSRKTTPYGLEITNYLTEAAAHAGVTVVSGLAFGIDASAHKAAIRAKGSTIAVLPSSLDHIYPASHKNLARDIINSSGLLISEYEDTKHPYKHYFIERNRIIAALSDVILVIEATLDSGSLHTVAAAKSMNKIIASVPGNINSPNSTGTNLLIKEGAKLISSESDLLSILDINSAVTPMQLDLFSLEEQSILVHLENNCLTSNQISEASGIDMSSLNVGLSMLEVSGVIVRQSNNRWALKNKLAKQI